MNAPARHLLAGTLVAAVVLVGCGDDEAVRDEEGRITEAGTIDVFELRPGDCLDPDPDLSGTTAEMPVVPCDEPHLQEVFAIREHPDDAYPGAAAVAEWADAACSGALEEELGLGLDDGVFFSYLLPTFDGWNLERADREIVCVLVFPDREEAVGSVVEGTLVIPRIEPAPPRPDEEQDDDLLDDLLEDDEEVDA